MPIPIMPLCSYPLILGIRQGAVLFWNPGLPCSQSWCSTEHQGQAWDSPGSYVESQSFPQPDHWSQAWGSPRIQGHPVPDTTIIVHVGPGQLWVYFQGWCWQSVSTNLKTALGLVPSFVEFLSFYGTINMWLVVIYGTFGILLVP